MAQRSAVESMMMELQMREMQTIFNNVSERCFANCVNTFRTRSLDSEEKQCIENCFEKFMKSYNRAGMRMTELSAHHQANRERNQMSSMLPRTPIDG
jgi:import inner membrane translocase subunit TIM9